MALLLLREGDLKALDLTLKGGLLRAELVELGDAAVGVELVGFHRAAELRELYFEVFFTLLSLSEGVGVVASELLKALLLLLLELLKAGVVARLDLAHLF